MASTPRWPLVVGHLLDTLPHLRGWTNVTVFDTDAVTTSGPLAYAVVARTNDPANVYTRSIAPSGLMAESGTVRTLLVTRTGSVDPDGVRTDGFALASELEDSLLADHTLDGVLGEAGTVSLTVEVQSVLSAGSAQSLLISISYTSLT